MRSVGEIGLLLLSVLLVCSCGSGGVSGGDSDSGSEAASESEDRCDALYCYPGICHVVSGVASCTCLDGTSGHTSCTLPAFDGDSDKESEADSDSAVADGDRDCDAVDSEADSEEAASEEWPPAFAGLPRCSSNSTPTVYPCVSDIPLTWTSDSGEFRIGKTGSVTLDSLTVWNEWIGFANHSPDDYYIGSFLYNYKYKKGVLLAPKGVFAPGPNTISIRDGRLVWGEYHHYDDSYVGTRLMQSGLDHIVPVTLSDSRTNKEGVNIFETGTYWASCTGECTAMTMYGILPGTTTEAEVIHKSLNNPASWGVYGKNLVFTYDSYARIGLYNLDTQAISDIAHADWNRGNPIIWANDVYWWDSALQLDPSGLCGSSFMHYNLATQTTDTVVKTNGWDDYLPNGVWQDWVVYMNANEGGGPTGDQSKCYDAGAQSDVILRYMPTGEEWNLTNHAGAQWVPVIWDHLVIWIDGRESPTDRLDKRDLYGIDLCKHPILKSRFPSCSERKR